MKVQVYHHRHGTNKGLGNKVLITATK